MSDPITRIEGEIAKLGAEHEPPAGWQARVLAATAPKRRVRWWWFALPAVAIATVIALVVMRQDDPQQLALAVEIESSGTVMRGSSAKVGDVIKATVKGGKHRTIWIYRDDHELVLACPGSTDCRLAPRTMTGRATVHVPGRYSIVVTTSDSPLPPPTGSLDADVAAAHAAKATSKMSTVEVR